MSNTQDPGPGQVPSQQSIPALPKTQPVRSSGAANQSAQTIAPNNAPSGPSSTAVQRTSEPRRQSQPQPQPQPPYKPGRPTVPNQGRAHNKNQHQYLPDHQGHGPGPIRSGQQSLPHSSSISSRTTKQVAPQNSAERAGFSALQTQGQPPQIPPPQYEPKAPLNMEGQPETDERPEAQFDHGIQSQESNAIVEESKKRRPWPSSFMTVASVLTIALLLVCLILVKIFISNRLFKLQIDILSMLLLLVVVFILGFLYGLWWHTLQETEVDPDEHSSEVDRLKLEVEDAQKQLDAAQGEIEGLNMQLENNRNQNNDQQQEKEREDEGRVQSQPLPHIPPISVYDKKEDPPDYEQEKTEHPHHKIYPAQASDESHLGYNWHIIGASRRGYGHSYTGKYREDDFAIRVFPDLKGSQGNVALVAIADGVSAKKYSRYGARAAVQGATNFFPLPAAPEGTPPAQPQDEIQFLVDLLIDNKPAEAYNQQAYRILHTALKSAMLSVQKRAYEHDPQLTADDLHSTLLVFLVVPLSERRLFIASTQIGDGILFSLQDNDKPRLRDRWTWLQPAQIQGSGNEVQPFMRSNPKDWGHFFKWDMLEDAVFVMGMTDGTADDIEPPRATADNPDPDPFTYSNNFYQGIKDSVLAKDQPAQALDEFLGYKKRQSYDDRTVICLYNKLQ